MNDIDPFELFHEEDSPAPEPAPEPSASPTGSELPYTIRTIIEQCGGMGLKGAFVCVGAERFAYKCGPVPDDECRSGYRSRITKEGAIDYDVGLSFRVNGKRGQNWTMLIVYEPDDTYNVYLWRLATPSESRRGVFGAVIAQAEDVYCDTLKDVVEGMYDRAIKEHAGGFIPL